MGKDNKIIEMFEWCIIKFLTTMGLSEELSSAVAREQVGITNICNTNYGVTVDVSQAELSNLPLQRKIVEEVWGELACVINNNLRVDVLIFVRDSRIVAAEIFSPAGAKIPYPITTLNFFKLEKSTVGNGISVITLGPTIGKEIRL